MKQHRTGMAMALLAGLAFAPPALAAATDAQRCSARKIKAAAKHTRALLRCYQKAMLIGENPDPACIATANERFSRKFGAADTEGCFVMGDEATVAATVASCTANIACGLKSGCCDPVQLVMTGLGGGTVQLGGLAESSFPLGTVAVVDVGPAADTECAHEIVVPPDGFAVPTFCVAGIYSADVVPRGCPVGAGEGTGTAWDGYACCADADVSKVVDTSHPDCDPATTCDTDPATGAGANSLGKIVTTRGDGVCDSVGNFHAVADIPVTGIAWQSASGQCPDPDDAFTPGTDTLVGQADFLLTLTTGKSTSDFVDDNEDGCSLVGLGPASAEETGTPSPGPCYRVGDTLTLVGTGPVLSAVDGLNDMLFRISSPLTISAINPWPGTAACTLTSDPVCGE